MTFTNPGLAACFAPLEAFFIMQFIIMLKWAATEEKLVLNKQTDTVKATYKPIWGAPTVKEARLKDL